MSLLRSLICDPLVFRGDELESRWAKAGGTFWGEGWRGGRKRFINPPTNKGKQTEKKDHAVFHHHNQEEDAAASSIELLMCSFFLNDSQCPLVHRPVWNTRTCGVYMDLDMLFLSKLLSGRKWTLTRILRMHFSGVSSCFWALWTKKKCAAIEHTSQINWNLTNQGLRFFSGICLVSFCWKVIMKEKWIIGVCLLSELYGTKSFIYQL